MEEERTRKLEAGRAKFAHFRERKAKSNVAQSQKKTTKRKGSSVHTHDVPQEEHTVMAQGCDVGKGIESKAEDANNFLETTTETEGSADLSVQDTVINPAAEEVAEHSAAEYSETDNKMCQTRIAELEKRLLEKQEAVERLTVQMDELQEQLSQHRDSMQLQETTVQEQNEVIRKLTSCLQQSRKDWDDLQEEALQVADQIHGLQLQLHQVNVTLKSKGSGKKEVLEAQQQMSLLQNSLREQKACLEMLHQRARDLEVQLESSQKDREITGLKNEITKMKEQQHIEELRVTHKKDVCRQLEQLKAELEKCHRKEMAEAKQIYEEVILKYKSELEQLKKELFALNSEEHIQNLNRIVINLNNSLHESETGEKNLRKELENQQENFQREKTEVEIQYKVLINDLKSQLSKAEKQVKEAQQYEQEKQHLNEEIQKLNYFIQELNKRRLFEAEKSKNAKQKHDEETVSNKNLREIQTLPDVLEMQKVKLEDMLNEPCQFREELDPDRLDFQCQPRIDSLRDESEEIVCSKIREHNESSGDHLSEEPLPELEFFTTDEEVLSKYLVFTERPEQSYVSGCSEGYPIEEHSSALSDPSTDFKPPRLNLDLDEKPCHGSLTKETFEEATVEARALISFLSDGSPLQNKMSDYGDVMDDERACVVERCVKLTEQLNKKKSALKKSHQETQEAVKKWKKLIAELCEINAELSKEREARRCCEEQLLQKTEREKELESKINLLVKQQGEDGNQPYGVTEPTWQQMIKDLQEERQKSSAWQKMVEDLQEEKEMLMMQLQTQEQLVKEVQEQKIASDSVTSEVQTLFGRQLAALQSQRNQMQNQRDAQKVNNVMLRKSITELLGQKIIREETMLKEQELLKAEINNKEQDLALLVKEKTALGEKLLVMEEDLVKAEKALAAKASIIADLEKNIHEVNIELQNMKEVQECERLRYEDRLNLNNMEINKLHAEIKAKSTEYTVKESQLTEEIAHLKKVHLELENYLQESFQSVQDAKTAQSEMMNYYKEESVKMNAQHLAELTKLSLTHKKEIEELNAEIKDKVEKQKKLEEERVEQLALVKKVHEREHDREISELIAKHKEEMEELRAEFNKEKLDLLDEHKQQMAAIHKAEIEHAQLQSQTLHSLEMEALRLSLNNLHTSQLELTQSNLRKEKETALVELREMLNDKRAQEIAILQSRHQLEREKIKEHCLKEKEDLTSKHQQELVDQRKKIELEMEEKHIQILETLKRDWELESEMRLKYTCEELSKKHQAEIAELQRTLEMELEKVKAELGLLSLEKEQSEMKCVDMEKQHQLAITTLTKQLQSEHSQLLEDMKIESQEKEQNLQKELEKLQVMHEEFKTQSQEEVKQLWSQLGNTRANRQELSELKEQLMARASQVEETEHLKQKFEEQRQQTKSEHEAELEQLRIYFERKLRITEENYREELTLLHQRLQELKEYSVSEVDVSQDQTGNISSSVTVFGEAAGKEGKDFFLDQLNQQLEQHKEEIACLQGQLKEDHRHELDSLKSSLALQYKGDLLKMKMDLSDKYTAEIEEMKRKHCLELEQLRARLSEEHIKEITKLRLQSAQDAARQVEMEVAKRVSVLEEEHKVKLSLLHSEEQHIAELSEEIKCLKEEITKQKDFFVQNEKHLIEQMEQVKLKIAEGHENELKEAREEVQKIETLYKEKEMKWKCESEEQRIQAEEKLSLLHTELQNRLESEKQNLQKEFELRETQMHQLQDHQAARIVELEKLVKEQQNNLQQLEDSLAAAEATQKSQEQHDSELQAAKVLMEKEMEKAKLCLQEECALKLMEAQNKFMEEHKALTRKFTAEQEILLQELKKKHVDELELQSQQLQEKHKQQILSLTNELHRKHQTEIMTLKSTLESKQQIQLEAFVAELQTKHQAQIDVLEAKHLSNLDSLESSYLSEIQNIRDEHRQVLEKLQLHHTEQLHEKDKMNQACLAQEIEMLKLKHAEELQLAQNNLKIELATVHMEKLKIMAVEVEEAHKDDLKAALQNQRSLLEEEKRLALDILREEVVQMEEKHRKALQELQDLHEEEIKKHKEEYSRELEKELEKLKAQHEHEQEMYASASASEVETVRTALLSQFEAVKMKQQLQFQEEIELLKCQSEVLLEQQIAQLKDEFEAEKTALIHDQEQVLIQEREKAEAACLKEKETLSAQLQENAARIIQLEKKVESLNCEIQETNCELETLIERRDRENQEGGNLVAMLRSDIEQSKVERKKMEDSYQCLLKWLMELVKATIAVEDLICSKIGLCLDSSMTSSDSMESHIIMEELGFMQYFKAKEKNHVEKVDELLDETLTEHSQLSPVTEEQYELSQYLCESVFAKPEMVYENEEMILKICHRLRTAVERLLELVTESTKQLEKTHEIHAQFEEEFTRRNQETAQVVSQHQELMECLTEESEAKNQLALELHKAEGIIEGYVAEKAALEEALNLKEESERRLVVELENMRERFQELTQEQAILGLLKEVELLAKEKLELECQAEKDHSNLRSQMKVLEMELEEQLHSNQDLTKQLMEAAELKQQIEVLEKQLKNQRQFMDEQAIEREHERDDFQQEIKKLEEQLKLSAKLQNSGEPKKYGNCDLILQVESLQAEVKEKVDDYNKLLLEKEQKHQEIAARDKEIEKLVAQVQELEHSKTEVSKTVNYLQQQLQKMKKVETELKQDKEALQQQQYNNLIQISALQSKLDEVRHGVPVEGTSDQGLKERLQAEQESLERKEGEIASLLDHLEQHKDKLTSKNEEILQLKLQLEVQKNLSTFTINQLQVENAQLKVVEDQKSEIEELRSIIEHLRGDQERLCKDKDEEVEQLHGVIEKLQKELAQFGPVCHEVSDNQGDIFQFGLEKSVENLQKELKKGLIDCQGDTDLHGRNALLLSKVMELEEELEFASAARKDLLQQLEEKESQFKMEVEILDKKCQNLQESSRQHCAELNTLRLQYSALQEEYSLLQTLISQRESEARIAASHVQELKDSVKDREVSILGKDKQVKTMADQRKDEEGELQYLTKQASELETELKKRDASQAQDAYGHELEVSRLDLHEQAMNQEEVSNQRETDELQGNTTKLKDQIKIYTKELEDLRLERDELIAQLELYKPKEQCDKENANSLELFCWGQRQGEVLKKGMKELEALETHVGQSFASPADNLENVALFDFTAHDRNKQSQVKQSEETISIQKLDMISSSEEQQTLKKQHSLIPCSPETNVDGGCTKGTVKNFQDFIVDVTSWDSPEVMRKQDTSMELPSVLNLTPFSEAESTGLEMVHSRSSLRGDNSVLLGFSHLYVNGSEEAADRADVKSSISSKSTYSADADDEDMEKKSLDDVRSGASAIDVLSNGCDSSTGSNLAAKLNEQLQTSDHSDANFMAYLQYCGMFPDIMESVREKEMLSPQLKTVLKLVYEESHKILALSDHSFGFRELKNVHQTRAIMEGWQKEGLALLNAIQSLKDYLSKMADRGDKEEQRQMVVEHLFSSDRNNLLSEIQELRAQLRMTHLQNQEKLQQLQETLTNVEDHGSKQEHQLRRKVELLEYKLQQEKCIVSDLHSTLSEEQKRASETCELLNQEKAAVSTLKSDLYEHKQENERLQKSLEEHQREINKLRSELESKEKDLTATLQELQTERLTETELRALLEEQQLQHKKAEDEKKKALEDLQAALDLQMVQNNKLSVSLEHEQIINDNLRKELRIEYSRCEALLSQEHDKVLELQKNLDAERNHSLELLNSLNHERVLTEQLSMQAKEDASCQRRELLLEQAFIRELQAQLEEERSHKTELVAIIEKTYQKAIRSNRQLEAKVQMCCEETQMEKETTNKLRATLESLQSQKQEQNLELQHQRDEQRIKEMQEIMAILEETERSAPSPSSQQGLLCTSDKDQNAKEPMTKETGKFNLQQQQQLEKIRQQLLFVAARLIELMCKTVDKTVSDWYVSNDEAVASLLQTLKELKSDLLSPPASQIRSTDDTNPVQELERAAWQQERSILQNALKQAESELAKATAEIENKPTVEAFNPKLQRLYRKYLRAESFRKALVYQKKYLLLLLGGFQDCEQATLSLIARMGIYPSPADLQLSASRSRPFTKFRCAVRAVIAVSRLKFLVRKWNKLNRKNVQAETISQNTGNNTASSARTEALKQQQLPAVHVSSPPTRDTGLCHRTSSARSVSCSSKSSHRSHSRLPPSTSEKSPVPTQDPERSLTEYIHRLEIIQQRLGGMQPGQVPGPPCQRNMKK
ncbi:pericentrin isoform X8 [Excalfactoria chinensis]|uniref:pericentrin isoform X8 n=1 Tax=Excalfactoria chinensis TaxID=46218 RepID=UPI003B3A518F